MNIIHQILCYTVADVHATYIFTQEVPKTMNKMQLELVQSRKEHNATIKQLNEIVVQMDEKITTILPPAQSSEAITKVFWHSTCTISVFN